MTATPPADSAHFECVLEHRTGHSDDHFHTGEKLSLCFPLFIDTVLKNSGDKYHHRSKETDSLDESELSTAPVAVSETRPP